MYFNFKEIDAKKVIRLIIIHQNLGDETAHSFAVFHRILASYEDEFSRSGFTSEK